MGNRCWKVKRKEGTFISCGGYAIKQRSVGLGYIHRCSSSKNNLPIKPETFLLGIKDEYLEKKLKLYFYI